ncbi:pimeloyl-ACP methyl ester carboxylesterase [Thermocatellispora tengchongensis]|uniref:Pimeloyl-ACP methyl ester carboxylesterase n=1 Tax=Thermocatellispora tengchongensis TaxID=1073253 RepID=A0A840PBD4_9ACTN|nr:alpha/beta hydrolase [Thermocatellispora tengchongensis]MBB5136562.1 pimeloyl-ACP methyl ester carboxylesterase [Thermocatellispora tengchongensis]
MTSRAAVNGIEIAYETFGRPGDRPLLLIMGLGSQMILWDEELCEMFAARGHHVVRFDNRDVGLSTHLDGTPVPDLAAVAAGTAAPPYTLEDMAEDAAGLIDALGWDSAHVVGASMGGMIAQVLAIAHPGKVRTLTSIMSTTGPNVGQPTEAAMGALMRPPVQDREAAVESALAVWSVIGSPGYPMDPEKIARTAALAYDRAYDPAGSTRQLLAIFAAEDRTQALGRLSIPALVIHGEADPLVQLSGGKATAEAIPGARLITFPGMGHDLPRPLWERIVDEVSALTAAA